MINVKLYASIIGHPLSLSMRIEINDAVNIKKFVIDVSRSPIKWLFENKRLFDIPQ